MNDFVSVIKLQLLCNAYMCEWVMLVADGVLQLNHPTSNKNASCNMHKKLAKPSKTGIFKFFFDYFAYRVAVICY